MAREFLDNIQLNAGKPLDARYLSPSNIPYSATTQVNSLIPITQRFTGLTVNVGSVEYWYASGVTDAHLIKKSGSAMEALRFYTGTTAPSTYHTISDFNDNVGIVKSFDFPENVNSLKSNIDVVGQGTVTLTNGSSQVIGNGTNFLDATPGTGFSYWWNFYIVDSENRLYKIWLGSIESNTGATIGQVGNETMLIRDPAPDTVPVYPSVFTGASGTYSYKIVTNHAKDLFSFSLGNASYSKNYSTAFGGSTVAIGQTSFATGFNTKTSGAQAFTMGKDTLASGDQSLAIGYRSLASGLLSFSGGRGFWNPPTKDNKVRATGSVSFNFSENTVNQTAGHGALANNSAILGGINHNVPSTSPRSVVIGGDSIKVGASITNTVHMPKIRFGLGNSAALTTDNTNDNVLVRDASTGEIKLRAANTIVDKNYVTGITSNILHFVDNYGAVGDGTTNDSAAIQRAIDSVGSKGTIYFTKGKTYIIDETIELPVALGMVGYGAILKRKNAIATTTTQSLLANATTITVSSTTGFKVGDKIILCDVTLPYGGRGYTENSANGSSLSDAHTITTIVGNTINLSAGLRIAMPIGSTVVKVYDMFNGTASTIETSAQGNRILGIEFDGNVANNNHTNSWVFNKTIDNLPTHSLIEDCTFHDIPAENVFISNNTTVRNNRAYDLNGSFIHVSQASSPNSGYNNFIGNKLKNICLATNEVTDHSEGAFTMSASPQKIFCSDNYVENCSGSFFSPISDLSKDVTIINNKAYNCDGIVTFYNFGDVSEKVIISDNIFENCGWMQVQANQGAGNDDFVEVGRGHDHYNISDNIFVNVKFRLQRASQFSIKNNEFITTTGHTYSTTDEVSDRDATISLTRCTQYTIEGNSFDNRAVALDAKLHTAINCEYGFNLNLALAQPIKSNASTNTEYCYYNRYVKITNNKIHNYRLGIMDYYPFSEILPARSLSWIGFEISNNLINLRPSNGVYAIVAGPGSIVHNNKIYSTSSTVAPLRLLGVNNGSGTTYNTGGTQRLRLNGAIAYHNTVIGSNKSIEVGSVNATYGNNIYNCQVINNFVDGTVVDNTAGASTISGTITLINESLILQNIRQNPEFY